MLEESLDELKDGLKQMAEKQLTLPEVLFELQKSDGEIIAEAELVWHSEKLLGLFD